MTTNWRNKTKDYVHMSRDTKDVVVASVIFIALIGLSILLVELNIHIRTYFYMKGYSSEKLDSHINSEYGTCLSSMGVESLLFRSESGNFMLGDNAVVVTLDDKDESRAVIQVDSFPNTGYDFVIERMNGMYSYKGVFSDIEDGGVFVIKNHIDMLTSDQFKRLIQLLVDRYDGARKWSSAEAAKCGDLAQRPTSKE